MSRPSPARRLAVILVACVLGAPPAAAQEQSQALKATDLFSMAGEAEREKRFVDAEALYRALTKDPDPEIRAEARFRLGIMLSALGRQADAALLFRQLLDEKPNAQRVRLELARVLALIGDEAGARRELRQAQAGGLPADVAQAVDQFSNVLRARKPFGGSISFAFVPDSNINRATDRETLDTIIAPLDLSEDAREQSGIGVRAGGQAYARLPLAGNFALLPRLSAQAELYRQSQFNDISASATLGAEWTVGARDQLRPAISQTVRFYGGDLYAQTQTALLNWTHDLSRTAQLDTSLTVARADYELNDLQDGWLFDLSSTYERAFSAKSGGGITLNFSRQTARDPGYATTAAGATLLYGREISRSTMFATLTARRLIADERLFLFPDKRREWLVGGSLGASFRRLAVAGFAPLVRVSYDRNFSTVGIYDYSRFAVDLGITRAF